MWECKSDIEAEFILILIFLFNFYIVVIGDFKTLQIWT